MSSRTIQAPSRNLVTAKMTMTTAVDTAPSAVDDHLGLPPGVVAQGGASLHDFSSGARWPIFHQRRAMPVCERVKDMNTPMA